MSDLCPPHKYRRRNLTRNPKKPPYLVYSCVNCSHYIEVHQAIGKEARCYKCNDTITITAKHAAQTAKPICDRCKMTRETTKKVREDIDRLVDELFK